MKWKTLQYYEKDFFVCLVFSLIVWQNFERFFTIVNSLPEEGIAGFLAAGSELCQYFWWGCTLIFSKLMICKKLDLGSGKFGLRKGQGIKRLLWAIKTRWNTTLCSEEELLAGLGLGQVEQSQDQQSSWDFHIKPTWDTFNLCFLCVGAMAALTDTCSRCCHQPPHFPALLFPHLVRNSI